MHDTSAKITVLLVHGGNANNRADDGIAERTIIRNTYMLDQGLPSFGEVLGEHLDASRFLFLNPVFPNATDANYQEWKRFFLQILNQEPQGEISNLILVGHSLGTTFLQRYLAEESESLSGKSIKQVHFVGSCLEEGNFRTSDDWEAITKHTSNFFIYHSTDDQTCPYAHGLEFRKNLPSATFFSYTDQGHFEGPRILELEQAILGFYTTR